MNAHDKKHSKKYASENSPAQRVENKNSGASLVDNRPDTVAQLAKGARKKHHDPEDKKYLAKGVGAKQNVVSKAALAIKQASDKPMTNKEAKRQAKDQLNG